MIQKVNAVFLGGKQAGCIGLITLLARGFNVTAVVAYDKIIKDVADAYAQLSDVFVGSSVHDPGIGAQNRSERVFIFIGIPTVGLSG